MLETGLIGALGALDVVSRQVSLVDLVSQAGNSMLEKGSIGASGEVDMVSRQLPSVYLVLRADNYTFAAESIGIFGSADEVPPTVVFDQSTNTWSDNCFRRDSCSVSGCTSGQHSGPTVPPGKK